MQWWLIIWAYCLNFLVLCSNGFMLSFRQYNVFSLTSILILFDHIQIICLNSHACCRVNAYPSFKAIDFCWNMFFGSLSLRFNNELLIALCWSPVSDVFVSLSWCMVWLCYLACKKWLYRCCNQSVSEGFEGSSRFSFFFLLNKVFEIPSNLHITIFFIIYAILGV